MNGVDIQLCFMTIKELEKEIKGQITVLDKKELERVLKFINQILNDPTI